MKIWETFGLTENPYNPYPLESDKTGEKLFVGRNKEAKEFAAHASIADRATIVVEGDIGVGKTSFVNIQLFKASHRDSETLPYLLPPTYKIQLNEMLNPTDLYLTILSNILSSIEVRLGRDEIEKSDLLKGKDHMVRQSIYKTTSFSGGATVIGTGGQVSYQKTEMVSQPLRTIEQPLLKSLDETYQYLQEKHDYHGIAVVINNIDIFDEAQTIKTLNTIRDTLLTRKGYWVILIGKTGFSDLVMTKCRRVSEVLSGSIVIKPLTLEEVYSAIDKRIDLFRTARFKSKPLNDVIIKLLYSVSGGEIRFLFHRATELIKQFKITYPSENKISTEAAIDMLSKLASKRIAELNLSPKEQAILKVMVQEGGLRPKDFHRVGLKSAPSLMPYLERLEKLTLVGKLRDKEDKRIVKYVPTGFTFLAYDFLPVWLLELLEKH